MDETLSLLTDRSTPEREQLRKKLSNKERTALPRVTMPHAAPAERIRSLTQEVNLGLTLEQAQAEATRCLDCPQPGCIEGCPVSIAIPSFIKLVERGDIAGANKVIRHTSSLPAVCGRVCPQEKQCEAKCVYHKMNKEPVAIGYLERFVADNAPQAAQAGTVAPDGKPIAVVGSGPAGLSFAGEMCRLGYRVTVFEALHELGGVLTYGIPEYRLPNEVVRKEIDALKAMGVSFETNTIVGATLRPEDIDEMGFAGMFVASGAGLPRFMGIPGENYVGVLSSNEYLTRVNLMHAGQAGSDTPLIKAERVAVIGGGNTAMDAVRTALRMGAKEAILVYRRTEAEMPARREEILHAQEEGVQFMCLHNPIAYEADEKGRVSHMLLQKMELGEPDASGRRSPVPVEGAIERIPVDAVIVSVGVSPNPLIPRTFSGLTATPKGTLVVDESNATSLPGVYAGGDIVRGGATVILAMGDGRRAALAMHAALKAKS